MSKINMVAIKETIDIAFADAYRDNRQAIISDAEGDRPITDYKFAGSNIVLNGKKIKIDKEMFKDFYPQNMIMLNENDVLCF